MIRKPAPRLVGATAVLTAAITLGAACVPEGPGGSTTTSTQAPTTQTPTTETPTTETPTTETPTTLAPMVANATFTNTTGLAQVGSTVTVTGTGFDPALITPPGTPANAAVAGVYVAIGTGSGPVPTAYTSAKYIRPTGPSPETASGAKLEADGSFSATINTVALFNGQGQTVNCYIDACNVYVWSAHMGTVPSWSFSAPVTFAAPTETQMLVSKSADLANGETVTVSGVGYQAAGPGIYVGQMPWTQSALPADWSTNSAAWGPTKFLPFPSQVNASGAWRTTLATAKNIGEVDCSTADSCSIGSVRAHGTADPTGQNTAFATITFAP